jgi:uncharacterized protein YraI
MTAVAGYGTCSTRDAVVRYQGARPLLLESSVDAPLRDPSAFEEQAMNLLRSCHFFASASLVAALAFAGCSAAPEDQDLDGLDEGVDSQAEGVTGNVAAGTKLVATGNVNLRSGPSTSKSVLRVVPNGGEVVVKTSTPSGGFYEVTFDGTTGWTSGKFYTMGAPPDSGGEIDVGSKLVAIGDVNLRSGPSKSSSVLHVVQKGEQVVVQNATPQNDYFQVEHEGTVGWSHRNYYDGAGKAPPDDGGSSWSCTGSFATTKVAGGNYYSTSFGCWVDANGNAHSDSGDNCIPACLAKAKADGLCAGMSGPQCERETNWYAADSGRFGCLTRLKVTSLKNGKSAVVVVLDAGPACWVENKVKAGVLDLSSRVTEYLFGGPVGTADKAMVHVEEVPASTPLGPQ